MFVLTIDQQGSRRGIDRVPELLDALNCLPLRCAAERTAGDEVQCLADRPQVALDAALIALEDGPWSVGVGVGPIETPLPRSVRAGRGDAFIAARDAVERARRTSSVPITVCCADTRQRETADELQAVLRLIGWVIRTRNTGQWRVVHELRRQPDATQQDIAHRLGITQQTVSRALKTSGWREEIAAYPLALRLLSMLDLTSAHVRRPEAQARSGAKLPSSLGLSSSTPPRRSPGATRAAATPLPAPPPVSSVVTP
ncbi:MarR family transcriptional regulator [Devriesea agamarum]|uniref:MarR family transcriptional regulator n=1 Tax=Devriesea agamarum TaxID=472569 RepID=UPI0009FE99D8|nr:MarR family transcriptional regulator [Devriesea agamarum]